MMCVNIHNLFGPFTWWPAMPKMNKRNVMPRKRPKDGKKRRRTLRISVKNDRKKNNFNANAISRLPTIKSTMPTI